MIRLRSVLMATRGSKAVIHFGQRALIYVPVAAILAIATVSVAGCSEEAVASRSLQKVVHEEIKQFNKYHQREKYRVYQSAGRFYKAFKERTDYSTDIRRTNAVDTPFIATLKFTENTYVTTRRAGSVDAQKDSYFSLVKSESSEVVYTYVGGMWRKKEIY